MAIVRQSAPGSRAARPIVGSKRAAMAQARDQTRDQARGKARAIGRAVLSISVALAALVAFACTPGPAWRPAWAPISPAWASSDAVTSGLPVPRFVSLKADRVTVRGGPDKDHDVAWIYTRARGPADIHPAFQKWRRICEC